MSIRELREDLEINILSPFASKSKYSLGRKTDEKPCDIRTCFQRDRDRIVHSKAFRRLMHKTQVFISPEGDHYRTRLTHTMEVAQIARTIARALNLNEDLTEAIALGHDLGHTPFGHLGESDLNNVVCGGFRHNEQSVRVVDIIEKTGKGLNLTKEVIDGILNHRGKGNPKTLEGKIVQISDKIAYVNHDIDDAIRSGILKENDLPKQHTKILGNSSHNRIDFLIKNIIFNSYEKNDIIISSDAKDALYGLRQFLFENVYFSNNLVIEREKYSNILSKMYEFYMSDFSKIPQEFMNIYINYDISNKKITIICDYIAGMTDRFAITTYNNLFLK